MFEYKIAVKTLSFNSTFYKLTSIFLLLWLYVFHGDDHKESVTIKKHLS